MYPFLRPDFFRFDSLTCSYLCLKSTEPSDCVIFFDPEDINGESCFIMTDKKNRLVQASKKSNSKPVKGLMTDNHNFKLRKIFFLQYFS